MAVKVITLDDLKKFRVELIADIENLLKENERLPEKKWLKSPEVRRLLDISAGTLQQLRINGTLPFSKIGGSIYYSYDEIQRVLAERNTSNAVS